VLDSSRACKTCRRRSKTAGLDCVYEQARRDRLRECVFPDGTTYDALNRVCRATELNHKLIALLRDLAERTDEADSEKIEEVLSTVSL
jgi:hypothetical protein